MPRVARVVIADVAHHVTQRGNGRQFILANDTERLVYLDLLHQALREQPLSVLGYCLMSNHVHLVAVPGQAEVLAATFQQVHGRYAAYWNVAHATSGHVWQGRFYSCPMDPGHLWTALRYAELNPVRAGMVAEAAAWPWSSAAAHCGTADSDACLDMSTWRRAWSEISWRQFLEQGEAESELRAIRQCTHSGRPLGSAEFTEALEQRTHRRLTPGKGGRPRTARSPGPQDTRSFQT
ncbi:MAG: transposase [Acidobacteriota bacterium]|nr:transposase [Acidobacteriota bacterium]